jgi:hypothetical protein
VIGPGKLETCVVPDRDIRGIIPWPSLLRKAETFWTRLASPSPRRRGKHRGGVATIQGDAL